MELRVREKGLASLHLCCMSFCWLSRMPYLHGKAKKQKAMNQEEPIFQAPSKSSPETHPGGASRCAASNQPSSGWVTSLGKTMESTLWCSSIEKGNLLRQGAINSKQLKIEIVFKAVSRFLTNGF